MESMEFIRFDENPLVTPDSSPAIGYNINGPSVIRKPEWLACLPGKYLMYFAHHQGKYIRLAWADVLHGPWNILKDEVLPLEEAPCGSHVASPDIHIDEKNRLIIMYYHGVLDSPQGQWSFRAVSADGIHFKSDTVHIAPFYLRVFKYKDAFYGLAKIGGRYGGGVLLRSPDGVEPFVPGPEVLPSMRHAALRLRPDNSLDIFYSRGGDCPERILYCSMSLKGDWLQWCPDEPVTVLEPEHDYEGVNEPLEASSFGWAPDPVRQLRDPAVYEEDGRLFIFYSNAGERGICGAEVKGI